MSNSRQDASRKNGSLSHGPKTPEGKAISSQNAVKYGFFAKNPVIPGESAEEYQEFRRETIDSLKPARGMEMILAERIAADSWRLLRVPQIEAGILAAQLCEEQAELAFKAAQDIKYPGFFKSMEDYDFKTDEDETKFLEHRENYEAAKAQLNDPDNALGRAVLRDSTASAALSRLMRYESMLQRHVNRNLAELRRLQQQRSELNRSEVRVQNEPEQRSELNRPEV